MVDVNLEIEDHVKLHKTAARYQLAVLYFHLRKIEDPMCLINLPWISSEVELSDDLIHYCEQHLHKLLS